MSSTSGVLSRASEPVHTHFTHETKLNVMSLQHEWPRMCIVTGSPPGRHGVGQVYMRDLAKRFDHGSISCAALLDQNATWESATCEELGITYAKSIRRYETSWKPVSGFLGESAAKLAWTLKTQPLINAESKKISEFARSQNSQALLVVLESPFQISLAAQLCKKSGLPVYSLIWDHPEHVIRCFGHSRATLKTLLRSSEQAIGSSKNILVVGEHLKEWVRSTYQKESVVLRHAIDVETVSDAPMKPTEGNIKIGFAGSVTAKDGFDLLLETLDEMNWQLDDRKIELHLFGFRYVLESQQPRNIVYRGFMHDTADVIRELSLCDFTYLPQSFSPQQKLVTRYSFPTKLSTYLAAGRPVLALTPEFSEISTFWKQYNVGPICNQFDSKSLQVCLNQLTTDREKQTNWQQERNRACKEQFSIEANTSALNQFFATPST